MGKSINYTRLFLDLESKVTSHSKQSLKIDCICSRLLHVFQYWFASIISFFITDSFSSFAGSFDAKNKILG